MASDQNLFDSILQHQLSRRLQEEEMRRLIEGHTDAFVPPPTGLFGSPQEAIKLEAASRYSIAVMYEEARVRWQNEKYILTSRIAALEEENAELRKEAIARRDKAMAEFKDTGTRRMRLRKEKS